MSTTLTSKNPQPTVSELVADLVPPPHFQHTSLKNYIPEPDYPSQAEAVEHVRTFMHSLAAHKKQGGFFASLFSKGNSAPAQGLYLDGGFGVGKTHLLTAAYHLAPARALYGTFVEYTNLVGVLGYQKAVEEFSSACLVCIDEFELDDVGDTLLMTRLIRELSDRGVAIAATSNTLPRALGEGRFAAQDFLREIKAMADRFDVVRIDGEDYRKRDSIAKPPSRTDEEVTSLAQGEGDESTFDQFEDVLGHLTKVHPSRYGAMVDGIGAVFMTGVRQISDHNQALRFVVLIDRLYDRAVRVVYSGVEVNALFSEELLRSGYSKKYYRCLSRLGALASGHEKDLG